jgi:hypothetical protein
MNINHLIVAAKGLEPLLRLPNVSELGIVFINRSENAGFQLTLNSIEITPVITHYDIGMWLTRLFKPIMTDSKVFNYQAEFHGKRIMVENTGMFLEYDGVSDNMEKVALSLEERSRIIILDFMYHFSMYKTITRMFTTLSCSTEGCSSMVEHDGNSVWTSCGQTIGNRLAVTVTIKYSLMLSLQNLVRAFAATCHLLETSVEYSATNIYKQGSEDLEWKDTCIKESFIDAGFTIHEEKLDFCEKVSYTLDP